MRKRIKLIGLLLILVGLFSVAGVVASHAHAAAPVQPHTSVQSGCIGALVTSDAGTECLPPGTRGQELSGVTRICDTNRFPVNFIGDNGIYVIYPGKCQTFNAEDGTIYVDM
ncbi:hypothetical protein KSF_045690 [Reticulibacter mediterranei]|uniref:Secreted protein n=1 Tax=Reticulibacter mediterranei TaxID=2778369 RepID=A0A8J3ISK2_9CHLR|nr:hypothetical protein [Reticulibacter mediterranei]GHO94521.1 hypothetical protein KSF_045690 [Reticulibacter mediterranei]